MWCDPVNSFVVVAEKPPVLFPIAYYPYIFNRLEVTENASEFLQEGFSDIILGVIPELKDTKNTLYYAIPKYS